MTRIEIEPDLPGVGPVALEDVPAVAYYAVLSGSPRRPARSRSAARRERWLSRPERIVFKVSYPRAELARSRLRAKVRSGEIVKPECCQQCGEETQLQGHHHDYTKPSDVEWLCSRCHASRHVPGAPALSRMSPDV